MPNTRFEPWLSREEYDAFKQLAPLDPALRTDYDSWLEEITELMSVFTKSGVPVEKVHIGPHEFSDFCKAEGLNPDGVARAAFAIHKARRKPR